MNKELHIYDDHNKRFYTIYPDTDLKFKKNRELHYDKLYIIDTNTYNKYNNYRNRRINVDFDLIKRDNLPLNITDKIDKDSLRFRLYRCKKIGYDILDLSNMDLERLPPNIPSCVRKLFCSNNRLSDISQLSRLNRLEVLDCSNNRLNKIPKLSKSLIEINCRNNNIEELDILVDCNEVLRIDCSNNNISTIPKLESLDNLICNDNKIEILPCLTKLRKLNCRNNNIRSLGNYIILEELECNNNRLNNIPEYNSLRSLFCEDNRIDNLNKLLKLLYSGILFNLLLLHSNSSNMI
jgi:hypothetical protein